MFKRFCVCHLVTLSFAITAAAGIPQIEVTEVYDFDLTTSSPPQEGEIIKDKNLPNVTSPVRKNESSVPGQGNQTRDNLVQTSDSSEDELLNWEPPLYLQRSLVYYQTGFDDEGRPVWVSELGNIPLREIAEAGDVEVRNLDKHVRQFILRITKSVEAQNSTENEVKDAVLIVDCDGINLSKLANPKAVLLILTYFRAYKDFLTKYMGLGMLINLNYVGELILNMIKPIIGKGMEKMEIYGTNPNKWMSALRRHLPDEAIPTRYGGPSGFKPLSYYG